MKEKSSYGFWIVQYWFLGISFISIAGSIIFACAATFKCVSQYVPGPFYLGSFRGNDKILIVGCTYLAVTIACLGLCYHLVYKNSNVLKGSAAISLSLIVASLTNQNISHSFYMRSLYSYSLSVFMVGFGFLLLCFLYKMDPYKPSKTPMLDTIIYIMYFTTTLLWLLVIVDFFFVINQNVSNVISWIIFVWVFIIVALLFKKLPSIHIDISTVDTSSTKPSVKTP